MTQKDGQEADDTLTIRIREHDFELLAGPNEWFWRWFASGTWEPETFEIFERFIDPACSYIDIGCWIGPTLLYGCQLARSAYGVEADLYAYCELAENLALNRSLTQNVTILNACMAPTSGPVRFGTCTRPGDSMSSILFGGQPSSWTVEGLRFEEIIAQLEIRNCAFIKMDIEGGEYSLLPAMAPALMAIRPTLFLSLHPTIFLLSKLDKGGVLARGLSDLLSKKPTPEILQKLDRLFFFVYLKLFAFVSTWQLLRHFRAYKYFYDHKGKRLTFRSLFRVSSNTMAIVLTDRRWS